MILCYVLLWHDTSGQGRTGGVTTIWTTNHTSEIKRAFDWSKLRRFFCYTLTTTSGWQGTVVVSGVKEKEGKG